jgi:c-di-GMP-binding flagellar brake protein YcgR
MRLMISHPVRLRSATNSVDQPALLEDLSSGGACIRTATVFHAGDGVVLNVNLSPTLKFEQPARVVYVLKQQSSYQTRCGLRFVDLRPEVRMKIANYVMQERHGRAYGVQPFSHGAEPA